MAHWLRSLQNRRMYDGARNLIIAWTVLCALGLIAGLLHILNGPPVTTVQGTVSQTLTVAFWATVWVYPTAGLIVIAFITKPRAETDKR